MRPMPRLPHTGGRGPAERLRACSYLVDRGELSLRRGSPEQPALSLQQAFGLLVRPGSPLCTASSRSRCGRALSSTQEEGGASLDSYVVYTALRRASLQARRWLLCCAPLQGPAAPAGQRCRRLSRLQVSSHLGRFETSGRACRRACAARWAPPGT